MSSETKLSVKSRLNDCRGSPTATMSSRAVTITPCAAAYPATLGDVTRRKS